MRTSSARRSGAHLHVRTGGLVRAFRAHAGSTKRTIGANHLAGTLRQLTLRPTVPLDPPEVRSSRAHPNRHTVPIPQSGGQSRGAIQPVDPNPSQFSSLELVGAAKAFEGFTREAPLTLKRMLREPS